MCVLFSIYNDYGVLVLSFRLCFFIALMNVVIFTTFFDFSVSRPPLLIPDDLNLPQLSPLPTQRQTSIQITRIRLRLPRSGHLFTPSPSITNPPPALVPELSMKLMELDGIATAQLLLPLVLSANQQGITIPSKDTIQVQTVAETKGLMQTERLPQQIMYSQVILRFMLVGRGMSMQSRWTSNPVLAARQPSMKNMAQDGIATVQPPLPSLPLANHQEPIMILVDIILLQAVAEHNALMLQERSLRPTPIILPLERYMLAGHSKQQRCRVTLHAHHFRQVLQ